MEDLIPLNPIHFFSIELPCFYLKKNEGRKWEKKHLLADLSSFQGEHSFAEVFLGWNEEGIHAEISVAAPFDTVRLPDYYQGDYIEFFFDTRDVKSTGYTTRFCHHFYFLPTLPEESEEWAQAAEVTRFRTEDKHELCDSAKLFIDSKKEKKMQVIKIFIPAECLYGYDPSQFDRLGFTYRIGRQNGQEQYFSASDEDFSIEQQPSLWASLTLAK